MNQLLVVDDHRSIREPLAAFLRRQGYEVTTAADAPAARRLLQQQPIDLIILDIMLPGEDGLSLCRHVLETHGTPVILLTAKTDYPDRIAGLDLGAADYVTKPFNVDELVARVRSVLRRALPPVVAPRATAAGERLRFAGWEVDTAHRTLRDPDGEPVPLSTMEYSILLAFLARPNEVLSRDALLDLINRDSPAYDRSIDSHISRLRRKLEPDPRHPALLKTIWGSGYLLAARIEKEPA